jgi:chromosome segregation ATPase
VGVLKLVPVWAWLLLGLIAATGYLVLRLDHAKTALDHAKTTLATVTGERDVATARAASVGKTLSLQRQLTEDSNKATDHATEQAEHITAAVAVADDRARSLQQQVTDLLANRKRCPSDLASTGKTRDDLAVVLAELRRSADEEAGSLAEALDRSRIAGQLCESMYSAAMKAR